MGTNSVAFAMYIAIYLLFAIIFILWISSVIYRRCFRRFPARSGAVGPTIVVFQTGPDQELPRGLDVSVIESFPKFAYSRVGCMSTDTDTDTYTDTDRKTKMKMVGECVVCLAAFEENETLRLVPKCGHVFHADCVDPWLRSNATCPFCRANLLPDGPRFSETTPVQVQVVIDGNRIRG